MTFHRTLFVVSVCLALYGVWRVVEGFIAQRLCFGSYCARLGVMHEGFFPIAFLYAFLTLLGLIFARHTYSRMKAAARDEQ